MDDIDELVNWQLDNPPHKRQPAPCCGMWCPSCTAWSRERTQPSTLYEHIQSINHAIRAIAETERNIMTP